MVAALKAIKVPNVRWPGGCFADEYHWRKGIGPADQRPRTLNPNWGGVIEPNTFGTHEFMDFLAADRRRGVRLRQRGLGHARGSGGLAGVHDHAAAHGAGQGARAPTATRSRSASRFSGIGNESWGCGGSMTPDYYVDQLKIFARYARNYNAAHPMKKIAVGPDGADTGYTEAVMKAWKNKVWSWDIDGLSLHSYTVGKWPPSYKATGFGEDEYATCSRTRCSMDELIRTHSAIMDSYDPEKKIALVVDEWGAWLRADAGYQSGLPRRSRTASATR